MQSSPTPRTPAGDTIYNLSRYNELEVGEDDRPAHPPVLTRADVLWNPFDDLQPRVDRCAAGMACLSCMAGPRAFLHSCNSSAAAHTCAAVWSPRPASARPLCRGSSVNAALCPPLPPPTHVPACPMLALTRDAKEAADAAAREAAAADAKKQTRKQAKNFALMSFGAGLPHLRGGSVGGCGCCLLGHIRFSHHLFFNNGCCLAPLLQARRRRRRRQTRWRRRPSSRSAARTTRWRTSGWPRSRRWKWTWTSEQPPLRIRHERHD